MNYSKKSSTLWIVGFILLLTGGAWVLFVRPTTTVAPAGAGATSASSTPAEGVTVTSDPFFGQSPIQDGLRKYQSILFRFTLWIPQELTLKEYSETNTTTLVFVDPTTHYGFQIFVVPYKGEQISDERFKLDVPSLVREQATAIVVDGTPATMFYSRNAAFGETREVWFIKNGFLYEVTTYKALDTWLANIMQTWKFL